ncbi:MAG: tRNA lysidine(34) synthetase TilS [Acetobacteraceae bacterium]|nr:tRNA lysidine(34) synthetase TilS [Acetobacteraceae bacterium]
MPLIETDSARLPVSPAAFAARMAALGPFEPAPRIAVAVSGGADSLALALLARDWSVARGGSVLGLVVDHRLRPESGDEARCTMARLAHIGIGAKLLVLALERGSGLAERAREARYRILARACAECGIVHLLLGHHAADQAETVLIRAVSRSGPDGLAGMAALRETRSLRLLRPLLDVPPGRLRTTLYQAGIDEWVEDRSNRDPRSQRARLRALRADHAGVGEASFALSAAARARGSARAVADRGRAAALAERVTLRPEGFAVLRPGAIDAGALAALIQLISGSPYPPSPVQVAELAAFPRPATIGGARLLPAGRLRPGLLVVREAAAMAGRVPASDGHWDGRFRLLRPQQLEPGLTLGPLGADAARLRRYANWPSAVLLTLPALRHGEELVAVPHIGYPETERCARIEIGFCPPNPLACAAFLPA